MRHEADGTLERRDGKDVIRFQRRIPHPIERVWAAITSPEELLGWWGEAEVDLRAGGRFVLRWLNTDDDGNRAEMHATIAALEPPRLLETEGDIHGILRWSSTRTATGRSSPSRARWIFPMSFASRQSPAGTSTSTRSPTHSTDRRTTGRAGTSVTFCRSCTSTRSVRGTTRSSNTGTPEPPTPSPGSSPATAASSASTAARSTGADEIEAHLKQIFVDHQPASYLGKTREIRFLSDDVALLRAVVGMVPPGQNELRPELNSIQTLVGVREGDEWRIAMLQTTPARFDGRPDEAERLTAELREVLHDQRL